MSFAGAVQAASSNILNDNQLRFPHVFVMIAEGSAEQKGVRAFHLAINSIIKC